MKQIYTTLICAFLTFQVSFAQGPKWVTKAKRAVFSLMTFDKEDKLIKTGNGFFISDDGVGVSDFNLFKGAYRAVAVDTDGKELPVLSILGADDTFDVVKFQVDISEVKKIQSLTPYTDSIQVGAEVLVIPYSTQSDRNCRPGKVKEITNIRQNHKYFTFDLRLKESLYSCPVLTATGEVIGIVQREFSPEDMISHAVDINFILDQEVGPLAFADLSLKDIHIKKGLPLNEDEALVYLYMASSNLTSHQYLELVNDFINQFPQSKEGYVRRAQYLLSKEDLTDQDIKRAEDDVNRVLKIGNGLDAEALFSITKLVYAASFNPLLKESKKWSLDSALAYINQAIAIDPQPVYTQFKGDVLIELKRLEDALAAYTEVNKSSMASALSFYNTAILKENLGSSHDEILVLLDSCVNQLVEPYDMDASIYLFERARVLAEAERYREAMVDLDSYYHAVNGQVNAQFYYFREQIAVKAKMYKHAIEDIARAVELDSEELLYQSEYAALNIRVGRYQEALDILEQLLKRDSTYAEGFRLQGVAYSQLKDGRACESFKQAEKLGDPLAENLIERYCK